MTRAADPKLLEKCVPADQVPAPPWTDKQIAAIIVDARSKLDNCSARFDALAAWEKAGAKPVSK